MLKVRKPTIAWYSKGGLEDMFMCLFQCEREGVTPPENFREYLKLRRKNAVFADDHLRNHREPLVRAILADLRLKNHLGYMSLAATQDLSYDELRLCAIELKEQILKWMDGRIFDRRDLPKRHDGVKQFVKIKRRAHERKSHLGIKREELLRMKHTLELFLSYDFSSTDARPVSLMMLCDRVDEIISDDRFRSFVWHVEAFTAHLTLMCVCAEEALVTIGKLLTRRGMPRRAKVIKQPSEARPLIARTEMEKMRYELVEFIKLRHTPKEEDDIKSAQEQRPRVCEILADKRLKDHFGHVSKLRTSKMDHGALWRHVCVLENWLNTWLR